MKKNIFNWCMSAFLAGTLGFGVASCSDDDDNAGYGPLSVDVTEYTFDSNEAATAQLAVTSSSDWKVEVAAEWLTLPAGNAGYGTPGRNIKVTLTATENTEEQPRTAIVTFTNLANTAETASVTVTQPGHVPDAYTDTNTSAPAGMQRNASAIFKDIVAGWNLGNTLESDGADETAWGNPMTTQAMIAGVKAQGFNAIRIPVRWFRENELETLEIDPAKLARVKEVVDYAYNQGMYVILNSHHDQWYDRIVAASLSEVKDAVLAKYSGMWTQIATAFAEYDEHLIFSGTNEVIYTSQGNEIWTEPTDQNLFTYLNDLQQTFVDAVRATGGNNAWRTLIVQPWACNPDFMDRLVKPDDTVENRLALEFHYYQPWNFCQQSGDDAAGENMYYWGEPYADLPYSTNTADEIISLFDRLKYNYVDKGTPVIMGEYGAVHHQKTASNQSFGINFTQSDESRAYYLEFVVKQAKDHGFPAFFWDNNAHGTTGENFGLLDRNNNMTPYSTRAVEGIMKGAAEGVYPY